MAAIRARCWSREVDPLKGVLVRVAADLSEGGGSWNGPVDGVSREFAYVAIPENSVVHTGLEKPYAALRVTLERFGVSLPGHIRQRNMHLDPDFGHLTYGDAGEKAKQLKAHLGPGDLVVFYAGLKDVHRTPRLTYAVIGLFVVEELLLAADVSQSDRDINAHSRRVLDPGSNDVIVRGRPGESGRLTRCIPMGEYRDRAYRVQQEVLDEWGGLSVKDGYLQRSARLPLLLQPQKFLRWFKRYEPTLIQANN